ncbi:P-loop NTPase fold protein, partial [Methylomonas methanica]
DGEHGWTVGSNGTILTTRNGGQNWRTAITLHSRWPAPGYYFCLLLAAVLLWGLPFWTPPSITLPKQDKDQPWQPGEADRMAFQPIAEALSQLLAYEDTQPPLTVGITADWGRGKSSLMNMLKQRLEAESYRCVFYNAWHQQDEAQVLKSLLESVRQQLIPGFLTLRGLRLRRRLLWGRDGIPKFSFVLGLLGLLYFVAQPSLDLLSVKIVNPELKLADYRDWLFEQRGWQQAVMLTERDIEKLCKDDSHKAAETPAFSPADCLAISQHLTWAAPVPKTQRANHPPPINSSTEKPESKRRPPKTANANSKDEKSASLAKPEIAATAPGKVPAEFEAAMGCARKYEALRPCEFASVDALQATVAEVLGHDKILTNEQKQALTQIHSRLPNATSEHVQLMVSGILGCLAMMLLALLYTEITVLGENRLVKLFKPLLDKLSLDWTSLEAAGQHQLHRERFASLLNVLEPQQLVIFIDDLDRCQQQQAAKVLEVVNFLSSAHPSCFFVLGFYPEYLKACVGLNFSEIAKEMIKEKVAPGIDKDEEEQQEREVFAHHYLQKLINIEAPVPKPQAQHIHAMLKEPENGDNNSWQALVDYFRTRWKNTLKSINYLPVASLGLLILAVAGLWIYQPSPAQPAKAYKIFEAPTAIVATPPKPKDPDSPIEKERNQDNRASVTPAAPEDATALLTVPILASGLALLGLLLLLRRQPQWFEDRWGFALIFRLLNHFWPNPIKRQDSKRFQHALLHWHEVISLKTDAPRSLKAFKNRARYFAVLAEALYRNNPVLGAKPLNDTHWLSLAALHYVDPKLLDILPLYTNKFGTGTVDWRNIAVSDEDPKRKASIQRAVENAIITQQWHGGWPPREADITLFKWLAEGMKIH